MGSTASRVVHIGLPKAASTYLQNYFLNHPQIYCEFVKANPLANASRDAIPLRGDEGIPGDKTAVFTSEKLSESMIMTGDSAVWHRYKLLPGKWNEVSPHFCIDPAEAAARIKRSLDADKVLIVLRNQVDWLQSAYKYYLVRLPPGARTFGDFCDTPRGKVYLETGRFERLVEAYMNEFGRPNVKILHVEDLARDPNAFAKDLCAFVGVDYRPLPTVRANEGSTNYAALVRARWPLVDLVPGPVRKIGSTLMERLLPARDALLSEDEIDEIRARYDASRRSLRDLLQPHDAAQPAAQQR